MFELSGTSILGFRRGTANSNSFCARNPASGIELEPRYYSADTDEVDNAATLAAHAFEIYRLANGKVRGSFLRRIAANIEQRSEAVINRAVEETALTPIRVSSEVARTCNQLRLFAELVEEGSWIDARIDLSDPKRQPLPKPDTRSMLRPLGPVAVFCASNFPFAFSVGGGDTASALAAGNPVVVKAHHAHPGTAELVGLAISEAVRECDLPAGTFSLLYGPGSQVGSQLMRHPMIKAGGFTGSRSGGQALMKLAADRPEPIPFYAEMSSVNPVFVLPGALSEREEQIATGLHASVTLGAGQFCTNPGLIFVPKFGSTGLIERLVEKMSATASFTMLTSEISRAYRNGVAALSDHVAVKPLHASGDATGNCSASAGLFITDAESFSADINLASEVFGPSTLLITYSDTDQLAKIAAGLEGQLTSTIHATESELVKCFDLLQVLESKTGRIVFNGYPTGVEVCHSMVHGGPFPATSDERSTSVGTRAALRFARPVCYQDWPDSLLPEELRNSNPLNIWRMVNGELTKASIE